MSTTPFNPIQFKRTMHIGSTPGLDDIVEGEIATNLADGKIYSKNNNRIIRLGYGLVGSDSDAKYFLDDSDKVYATGVTPKAISVYKTTDGDGWKNLLRVQKAEAGTEIKVVKEGGDTSGWGATFTTNSQNGGWETYNHQRCASLNYGAVPALGIHNHCDGGQSDIVSTYYDAQYAFNINTDPFRFNKGSGITTGGRAALIFSRPIKISYSGPGVGSLYPGSWDPYPPTPRIEYGYWQYVEVEYYDSDGDTLHKQVVTGITDPSQIILTGPVGNETQIPGLVKSIVVRGENGVTLNGRPPQLVGMGWYSDSDVGNSRGFFAATSGRDAAFFGNVGAGDETEFYGMLEMEYTGGTQPNVEPYLMLDGSNQMTIAGITEQKYIFHLNRTWAIGAGSFSNGNTTNNHYFRSVKFQYLDAGDSEIYQETKTYTSRTDSRLPSHVGVAKIVMTMSNPTGDTALNSFLPELVEPSDSEGTFDIITDPEIWIKNTPLSSAPESNYLYNGSIGDYLQPWQRTYYYQP